jgi:hypothetical protein
MDAAIAAQQTFNSIRRDKGRQGAISGSMGASRESFQDVKEEEDEDDDTNTDNGEPVQRTGTNQTADTSGHTHRRSIVDTIDEAIVSDDELEHDPNDTDEPETIPRRTLSLSHIEVSHVEPRIDDHYPRHLSFSLAEDSVLTWRTMITGDSDSDTDELAAQFAAQELSAKSTLSLRLALKQLSSETADWTRAQLDVLHEFLPYAERNADKLSSSYEPRHEGLQTLQAGVEGLLRDEKEQLEEGSKELETLAAKLEYEIDGLKGRIEDVEAGVDDFERSVGRVEDRVTELEKDGHGGRDWGCVVQ